jgi:hypothetical protein
LPGWLKNTVSDKPDGVNVGESTHCVARHAMTFCRFGRLTFNDHFVKRRTIIRAANRNHPPAGTSSCGFLRLARKMCNLLELSRRISTV